MRQLDGLSNLVHSEYSEPQWSHQKEEGCSEGSPGLHLGAVVRARRGVTETVHPTVTRPSHLV